MSQIWYSRYRLLRTLPTNFTIYRITGYTSILEIFGFVAFAIRKRLLLAISGKVDNLVVANYPQLESLFYSVGQYSCLPA